MIKCKTCAEIIDQIIQTEADQLFKRSEEIPKTSFGSSFPCPICGRTWVIALNPIDGEYDYVPEGAVLVDENHSEELSELEVRESMEEFNESLENFLRGE